MINLALEFVSKALDEWLIRNFSLDNSVVELSSLARGSGTSPRNRLLISLINLDHESHRQYYGGKVSLNEDEYARVNPSERFNLDLMFTADFEKYTEALKYISSVLVFFQQHNALSAQSFPEMPQALSVLKADIENLSYFEMHNLWNAMGASYQPSMVYKLRHVCIDANTIRQLVGKVEVVGARVEPAL